MIGVSRQKFDYDINYGGVRCAVGQRHAFWIRRAEAIPKKYSSHISVGAVYNAYGLPSTYTYLKHLYMHKYNADQPEWLCVYLEGSLMELDSQFVVDEELRADCSPAYVLYLCSQLLSELSILDSKQPRMIGELENVEEGALPPEVLARIFGRSDVSKPVRSALRAQKCAVPPTSEELWGVRRGAIGRTYFVEHTDGYIAATSTKRYELSWDNERFHLKVTDRNPMSGLTMGGSPNKFSLTDYERVYTQKGCNVDQQMREMIKSLYNLSPATNANYHEIEAWIVQLSLDLEENESRTFYALDELTDEFERLVGLALALYP